MLLYNQYFTFKVNITEIIAYKIFRQKLTLHVPSLPGSPFRYSLLERSRM